MFLILCELAIALPNDRLQAFYKFYWTGMAARALVRPSVCLRNVPARPIALHPKILIAAARGAPITYRSFTSSRPGVSSFI